MVAKQSNLAKTIQAGSGVKGKTLTDEAIVKGVAKQAGIVGGNDMRAYGQAFSSNPKKLNEYMDSFAIKYGLTFIKGAIARQPYAKFVRGRMPLGGKIEAVTANPMKPVEYSSKQLGVESPFAVKFGELKADTFTFLFDVHNKNTLVDTVDSMYFNNWSSFNEFIYLKLSQLINGVILEEFDTVQTILLKAVVDGKISKVDAHTGEVFTEAVANPVEPTTKDLVTSFKTIERELQFFKSKFNSNNFRQGTPIDEIVELIPTRTSVAMDVDFGANAFNSELLYGTIVERIGIDDYPDLWQYTKDHTVTGDDIQKDFIDGTVYPVGTVIPAGNVAVEGATGAEIVLKGSAIKGFIMDRDVLQLWDQMSTTLSSMINPYDRTTNMIINQSTYIVLITALNNAVLLDTTQYNLPAGTDPEPEG